MIWKTVIILGYFVATIIATPIGIKNMQIMNDEEEQEQEDEQQIPTLNQRRTEMALSTLNLPSNATSIRADITDGFSCEDLSYGYYADIENDCQIFHVCLPVVYPDGKENTFRWSFICPEETVFSQDSFTCMRSEDVSFGCEESVKYYDLNRNFGMILDTSSELNNNNNNDMDMISNHMMKEKSELKQENISDDNDVIVEKLKPSIMKNDNQQTTNYIPTISTTLKPVTVKPVTVKLDSIKKRRKNPNRKSQPIRKTTTTTIASIPITTTFKTIEHEPEIIEKTTMKYQRFTRRPDIHKDNNNKKKIDILNKVITTTQTQKRKRPPVSLNLNSNKNDINIKKDEKPVTEINTILSLPTATATTQIPIPEITIEKETIKPIIVKNVEPIIEPLIVDIKEEEELLQPTTVITKYVETIPATEKPLLSDEIIPNMPEEEQQIAESNRITPLPNLLQQFIKDEEEKKESMTQNDDGNIKDNINNDNDEQKTQNNHDQQSMIINLISSLVNAENIKVGGEEEKFDNMNVQNSQNNNNNEKNNDEQANIMSELMTTKIPDVQETVKDENLNSEHVIVNIEDKLKNDDDMSTAENYNIQKHQSNMYNHMTHIPVRIISDDTLPIELIGHNADHAEQSKEVQQTVDEKHDKLESLNTDDKKLVMDKLEDALLEAIKMSEEGTTVIKEIQDLPEENKLNDELTVQNEQNLDTKEDIIDNHEVTVVNQSSEEVKPIYHRIMDEPANLLKPEILSVLIDEQPIIHNLDEDVKIVQEIEPENKIPELIVPNLNEESQLQEVIDSSSSDSQQLNIIPEVTPELTLLDKQPINENSLPSLTITEAQIPLESIPLNSNIEEQNLQLTETISSSTAEPIIDDIKIVSDRTNDARSLKKKMDPRKRRFLFRSDAR